MIARLLVAMSLTWAATAQAAGQAAATPKPKVAPATAKPSAPPPAPPAAPAPSPAAATSEGATPAKSSAPKTPVPPASPQPPQPPPTAELPAPPTTPPAVTSGANNGGEISLKDWKRDDWALVKPKVSLFELGGYFRIRGDTLQRLDFGNRSIFLSEGRYPANGGDNKGRNAEYTQTNMRLRLQPRINISQNIHIISTVDIFDNLVLGSTPNTAVPQNGRTPANIEATGQTPLQYGLNALENTIVFKRAYLKLTALNQQVELRVGRMPNQWGLGMMANAGDCIDCDYGDVADRIALSVKAAGHLFTGMFDWVSNGPLYTPFGRSGGQPLDAVDWDDVFQWSLQISHVDHPQDIQQSLQVGHMVLNYGLWNILRFQWRHLGKAYYQDPNNPNGPLIYDPAKTIDPSTISSLQVRTDANPIYTGDAYLHLYAGNFELSAEGAVIYGTFRDNVVVPTGAKTTILKAGGVLEMLYKLRGKYEGTRLSLKGGIASGDTAPGFGTFSNPDSQRGIFGPTGHRDLRLTNFIFSPDYHVDLLMFRRIIGAVTDAWYVRPAASYQFNKKLKGTLAVIYSQAIFKQSTPSCYDPAGVLCRATDPTKSKDGSTPMGIEADIHLAYGTPVETIGGKVTGILSGGMAFPLGAFKGPNISNNKGGSFAWTVQLHLNVVF